MCTEHSTSRSPSTPANHRGQDRRGYVLFERSLVAQPARDNRHSPGCRVLLRQRIRGARRHRRPHWCAVRAAVLPLRSQVARGAAELNKQRVIHFLPPRAEMMAGTSFPRWVTTFEGLSPSDTCHTHTRSHSLLRLLGPLRLGRRRTPSSIKSNSRTLSCGGSETTTVPPFFHSTAFFFCADRSSWQTKLRQKMVATRVAFATATTALLSGVEYLRPPNGEPLVACTSYFGLFFVARNRHLPYSLG